ncbi:protease inhibitor I9 family protein [Janthinobacterium sp. PAMC25594]|uniref:protease inhibitor I9 family protein n=1 Tax=Janthinobacterium sp. PAMC25594 TaxID=2861284 RepID=UPI001C6279E3|nr:protease inhibitor I9 family protein [Janthinobacterium sp. PAMC25594]QYG09172.1 protease inhibitor I9 family protein [Janthinobacterium sp. PAMC25594]
MSTIRLSLALLAAASVLPAGVSAVQRQPYIVQLCVQLTPLPDAAQREAGRRTVLALIPDATVQYQYTAALNGFAALLTPAEVKRLRASPLVARVSPDTEEHVNDRGARSVPDAQR